MTFYTPPVATQIPSRITNSRFAKRYLDLLKVDKERRLTAEERAQLTAIDNFADDPEAVDLLIEWQQGPRYSELIDFAVIDDLFDKLHRGLAHDEDKVIFLVFIKLLERKEPLFAKGATLGEACGAVIQLLGLPEVQIETFDSVKWRPLQPNEIHHQIVHRTLERLGLSGNSKLADVKKALGIE